MKNSKKLVIGGLVAVLVISAVAVLGTGSGDELLGRVSVKRSNQQDLDHDGLTNQQEANIGTDPLDSDTDGDGVNDGTEIEQRRHPLLNGNDNPGNDLPNSDWDYDLDGLGTIYERQIGTDPLNPDTDGDGIGDAEEHNRSITFQPSGLVYDPLNPCKPSISNSACLKVRR